MGKEYWMERLKESLPKNETVKPNVEPCEKCTGLTVDRADEIVGYLYAGIGELEVVSLELSKASSEKKMERALSDLSYYEKRYEQEMTQAALRAEAEIAGRRRATATRRSLRPYSTPAMWL